MIFLGSNLGLFAFAVLSARSDCVVKRSLRASSAPSGRGSKNQKSSYPSYFFGGGVGPTKNEKEIFLFCPAAADLVQ